MRTPHLAWLVALGGLLVAALFGACVNSSSSSQPLDGGLIEGFDAGDSAVSIPLVSVSASGASFGTVALGTSTSPKAIVITNTGNGITGTLSAVLGGAQPADFAIDSDACSGQTLAPDATCTITLHFAPTAAGTDTATLTVAATPGGSATVTITGTALAPGSLSMSPTQEAFPSTDTGSVSAVSTFTVTSTGAASDTLTAALTGTDMAQFTIKGDTCTGQTLAAGATCTVGVMFAPTAAGAKSATLSVTAAAGSGAASASLTGVAVVPGSPAKLAWAAAAYDAGATLTNASTTLLLVNSGSFASGPPAIVTSGANASDFVVGATVCGDAGIGDAGIGPGGSCNVTVTFTPKTMAAEIATVTATATPGGSAITTVVGAGEVPPGNLSIDHPSNTFTGVVEGATSAPFVFTLSNVAAGPTTALAVSIVGGATSPFKIASNGCQGTVLTAAGTPGATCTVGVTFSPTTATLQNDMLQVTAATGGTVSAMLSGTGITPAALTLTNAAGTTVPFGGFVDGKASSAITFTIKNTGAQASGVVTFSMAGFKPADFVMNATTCPTATGGSLAGGASCTAGIVFTPSIAGAESALFSVSATPGGTSSPVLTLSGTGYSNGPELQITPASVTLPNVVGDDSATETFTVTNVGGATTGTIADTVSATNFSTIVDSCNGATLTSGASCLIATAFSVSGPTAGVAYKETISVTEPTGTSDTVAATYTATLGAASTLGVDFADTIPVGGCGGKNDGGFIIGLTLTYTVTNNGAGATGALHVAVAPTFRGQFVLVPGQDNCTGVSVAPAGSCTFEVQYQTPVCNGSDSTIIITGPSGLEADVGIQVGIG